MNRQSLSTMEVDCDLCHKHSTVNLYTSQDYLHGCPGQWPVVQCKDCGLSFTNPRPTPETLTEYYPQDYCPYQFKTEKRFGLRHRLQRWAFHYHWNYPPIKSNKLGKLFSYPIWRWAKTNKRNYNLFPYQGDGRLLDFGCGNGQYLSYMAKLGWHVHGMDMSTLAVETCQAKGLQAVAGIRPDQTYAPEYFDVVTLWHVLEHVPSPTETLQHIHTVLKPGGKLIVAVPNIDSTLSHSLKQYWYFLDVPRHLTHFTPETLNMVLNKSGYRLECLKKQDHGGGLYKSLNFINETQAKRKFAWLAHHKLLCRKVQKVINFVGKPDVIIAHAIRI